MSEKHYNTDWAKAKSRDVLGDVIDRTLLKFRKPKNLRVLCFPGIDAQEIIQVYDARGIPRKNITGLERDRKTYEALLDKDLGINLVDSDSEKYFESQVHIDFDIVSLDYIGPLTTAEHLLANKIARKQIKNYFVYHQVNTLSRDKCSENYYRSAARINAILQTSEKQSFLSLERFFKSKKEIDLQMKSDGFSYSLIAALELYPESEYAKVMEFFSGVAPAALPENLSWQDAFELVQRSIKDLSPELVEAVDRASSELFRSRWGYKVFLKSFFENSLDHKAVKLIQQMQETVVKEICFSEVNKYKSMDRESSDGLARLITHGLLCKKKFFRQERERYHYISESGTPMIGDIYFMRSKQDLNKSYNNLISQCTFNGRFKIKDGYRFRNIDKLIRGIFAQHKKICSCTECSGQPLLPERKYLGNSSKPILTEKRAISEFKLGNTIDYIKQKYRHWRKKPIEKWYIKHKRDMPKELSKEDAYELIRDNIPLDEILEAYPNDYTRRQLAAFKAHITMGTYEK
tara:strand:- start:6901 stop:8454 length:1554 start_codon:yes stop_codon:yes gene_type:complete